MVHGARMLGLRRYIAAVCFLTPTCDPFFVITASIVHFVRLTGKESGPIPSAVDKNPVGLEHAARSFSI